MGPGDGTAHATFAFHGQGSRNRLRGPSGYAGCAVMANMSDFHLRSASSTRAISPLARARYLFELFILQIHIQHDFSFLETWEQELGDLLRRNSSKSIFQMRA